MPFKILEINQLVPTIHQMIVVAPKIANKAQAGQFIILRIDENGERIPLTIADFDRNKGIITTIFQEMGKTTRQLAAMTAGENLIDFVGPLGNTSVIERLGTVVCVGGGVGVAPIFPIARAHKETGNKVISIIGSRNVDLLLWEDRMQDVSDELFITTDDGTKGHHGFVTDVLQQILEGDEIISLVIAIGPPIMMKTVAGVTLPFGVKTVVSLNSIMVDGTGMCGACRVNVGGKTKFACVDGPEFDAHEVDFTLLMNRLVMYLNEEKEALDHYSHMGGCQC